MSRQKKYSIRYETRPPESSATFLAVMPSRCIPMKTVRSATSIASSILGALSLALIKLLRLGEIGVKKEFSNWAGDLEP